MDRSKLTSGVTGFFILLVLIVGILTMSLCIGIRNSINKTVFGGSKDVNVNANVDDSALTVRYSAVLSEGEIYVYDSAGKLYKTVKTYEEFLTDSDKALLSAGLDFYSEEEMLSFMNDFS